MNAIARPGAESLGASGAETSKLARGRRSAGNGEKRAQADRRRESMTLILDQAEVQFAHNGYNGVTLRDVADAAGVDTALMRYYFGDKERLFSAVWDRRAPLINDLKSKAMADYRSKAGDSLTLEGVIEAFIRPPFELMAQDEGWRNYMAIVALVNSSGGMIQTLMLDHFDKVSGEVIADFSRLFPNASKEQLYWGYHFLSGALTFSFGQTGRTDLLSGGLCNSRDALAMLERLPITLGAGIRALCETPAHPLSAGGKGAGRSQAKKKKPNSGKGLTRRR